MHLHIEQLEDRLVPVTLPPGFSESVFAAGLSAATAMAVAPDGRIFVAEQGGTLRVVQNATVLATPFVTISVDSSGERGLIGVTLDPNFASNHFVYVYHTVPGGTAHNRVTRFTANGNVAAGAGTAILDLDNLSSATNHNGGAIHFGPDGKLYVAVGDNANGANAQSLSNRLGKMLRINADGSIPTDNPFFNTATGANRAIWALGLRNPFTFAFDSTTGAMFINDVGQNTFEEIDAGAAGANYGWPTTEGDFNQASFPNFTRPVYSYSHSDPHPKGGTSIIGGAFYRASSFSFPVAYAGDYFFTDLTGDWINVRDSATGVVTTFADNPSGDFPVGLDIGPSGQLLYLSRSTNSIHQIAFGSGAAPIAVGTGDGVAAVAKLVDPVSGAARLTVFPFGANFRGGARVAGADVTGDSVLDLIVGAGPGGGPDVRVFDGASGARVRQFFAFEGSFTGGVFVAAGDLNGDSFADIAVSADVGGGPRIRIIDGKSGTELANFFGIDDAAFRGGTRIAIGNVGGDSTPDLVVSAGIGGGPRIAVFDGATLGATPTRLRNDFFAFEPALRNGAFVAAADADGDGDGDIIVGAGRGGSPRIVVFDGPTLSLIGNFIAGDVKQRGGVRIAARNFNSDAAVEIVAGAAAGSPPAVGVYELNGGTGRLENGFFVFDSSNLGGVFVG